MSDAKNWNRKVKKNGGLSDMASAAVQLFYRQLRDSLVDISPDMVANLSSSRIDKSEDILIVAGASRDIPNSDLVRNVTVRLTVVKGRSSIDYAGTCYHVDMNKRHVVGPRKAVKGTLQPPLKYAARQIAEYMRYVLNRD